MKGFDWELPMIDSERDKGSQEHFHNDRNAFTIHIYVFMGILL